jgi:flagellar motor switch/type III secretory pathway protein FliN
MAESPEQDDRQQDAVAAGAAVPEGDVSTSENDAPSAEEHAGEAMLAGEAEGGADSVGGAVAVAAVPQDEVVRVDPLARLRRLPVQVSVRLAETRIPMSQLMNIAPGMLIPFNKSCDDLLDLYVNNARFCRGEAVKIGEKFGLKIDEVGVQPESQQKVIQA